MSDRDKLPLVAIDNDARAAEYGIADVKSGWAEFATEDGYTVGSCYMGDRAENFRRAQRIVALINRYGWEGDIA